MMLQQAGETSITIIVALAIKRRNGLCSGEVCPGLIWESIPGQPLSTCLKFSSCQSVSLIWAGVSKHLRDFFSPSRDKPRPHRHRASRKNNRGGFSLPKHQDALKDSKTESAGEPVPWTGEDTRKMHLQATREREAPKLCAAAHSCGCSCAVGAQTHPPRLRSPQPRQVTKMTSKQREQKLSSA